METLSDLYENGYYSPKLVTDVSIPQWAKLLDYRNPITGIFAVVDSSSLKKVSTIHGHDLLPACSLTIISDTDEVEFFDKCQAENIFAIVYTGRVVINIITSTKIVTYNGCIAYKVRFTTQSNDDDVPNPIKFSNIATMIVCSPNSDYNSFPDSLINTSLECDVSGDPDLIDDIISKKLSVELIDTVDILDKPSIFGFFW